MGSQPSAAPEPVRWPRAAVTAGLAALALALDAQELLLPAWNPHSGPVVLSTATLVVVGLVLRHARRLDPARGTLWRGFAVIAALLALGHLLRATAGAGVNAAAAGPSDLALAATGPITVLVWVRLVRSTGDRIRARAVLDGTVTLAALVALGELLVPLVAGPAAPAERLLTVYYPAVSAVLCAVGVVTLAAVSAPRRAAAGWLVLCFASLAVVTVSGALAVGHPSPVLDVVASTAYLAVLGTATLALDAHPGVRPRSGPARSTVPLVGVVLSHCLSSGAVLLLLGRWATGRPPTTLEAATVGALMLLTVARTLVWARNGARLSRQVLRSEFELERLAYTDFLTGLPNRARLMASLEAARVRAAAGDPSCVVMIDLDGFKAVNDVAGHEAGDRLLCEVADELRRAARDHDLVARLGGDEFALVVPGGLAEARALAARLSRVLDHSFRAPSQTGEEAGLLFDVSGSIGVAEMRAQDDGSAALRQADLALRAAKAAGKNRVRSAGYGVVDEDTGRRSRLVRDLPLALRHDQFELAFQPVVGFAERRVLGLEALLRWRHPELGTVPPDEFITLAEEEGLIVPLQRWVMAAATATLAPLLAEGRDLQLGVNVSVRHLQAGCLAADVARVLAESGVPAHRLMLEITETVLLGAEDRFNDGLSTLREMGCILSLDDFGKGYSSLARLARLPVDVLKMDRAFVAHIEQDPRTAAIVGSVVELGHTLGIDVVAEGVETAGQLAALRGLGCRYLQGHLLGRPVPPEQLRGVIDGFDPSVLDPTDAMLTIH